MIQTNLFRSHTICLLLTLAFVSSPHNVCEGLQVAPAAAAASGAWTWYKSMLIAKPLVTKSITSSCIAGVSDVMCQKVVISATPKEERTSKLDSTRVLHTAITGAVWSGPITHFWYIVLEK